MYLKCLEKLISKSKATPKFLTSWNLKTNKKYTAICLANLYLSLDENFGLFLNNLGSITDVMADKLLTTVNY